MEEDITEYNEKIDEYNKKMEEENKELVQCIDEISEVLKKLIDDIQSRSNKEFIITEGKSKWKKDFVEGLEISDKFKEYLME